MKDDNIRICGVVAEFDPFHNGHSYFLEQARARSGCDYLVVCMTGSFTQRGEAACLDKMTRVRHALACGADAVFELSTLWAVRPADAFALGGISVLSGIGCDALSFGCETEDVQLLRQLAALRDDEPAEVSKLIRSKLERGVSHAAARGEALSQYLGISNAELNRPNMILATEYIRCLSHLEHRMEIIPIRRRG